MPNKESNKKNGLEFYRQILNRKPLCYMFDHSFLHPFDGKSRSATGTLCIEMPYRWQRAQPPIFESEVLTCHAHRAAFDNFWTLSENFADLKQNLLQGCQNCIF